MRVMPEYCITKIIEHAQNIGLANATPMGLMGLPWHEIKSYADINNITDSWVLNLLKQLSDVYIAEFYRCNEKQMVRSVIEDDLDVNDRRKAVNQKIKRLFESGRI